MCSAILLYIYILRLSSQCIGIAVFEIVVLGFGDGSWSCS